MAIHLGHILQVSLQNSAAASYSHDQYCPRWHYAKSHVHTASRVHMLSGRQHRPMLSLLVSKHLWTCLCFSSPFNVSCIVCCVCPAHCPQLSASGIWHPQADAIAYGFVLASNEELAMVNRFTFRVRTVAVSEP